MKTTHTKSVQPRSYGEVSCTSLSCSCVCCVRWHVCDCVAAAVIIKKSVLLLRHRGCVLHVVVLEERDDGDVLFQECHQEYTGILYAQRFK